MLRSSLSRGLTKLGFESRIARNSIVLGGAEILVRVLNTIITISLYRYLQPEGAGTLKFVINFGILFAVIGEGGISRPAIRFLARAGQSRVREFSGIILVARTILSGLMLTCLAITLQSPIGTGIEANIRHLIYFWSMALVFQTFRRNSEIVFQALQCMHYHAAFLVLNRVLALILQLCVIKLGGSIEWVIAAYVAADFIDALVALSFVWWRFGKPVWPSSLESVNALFREGIPFAVNLVCQQLRYYLDVVLLKYLYRSVGKSPDAEIGLYSSAATFVTTFLFIPNSLCSAVFPELARSYKYDAGRFRSLARDSMNLLLYVGLGLSVTFYFLRDILPFIFGASYRDAVPMLAIVVWVIPFVFMTTGLSAIYAAADRQGVFSTVSWLATVVKIAGAYLLMPQYGGKGAAIVFVGAEMIMVFTLLLSLLTWETKPVAWRGLFIILTFHSGAVALLYRLASLPFLQKSLTLGYVAIVALGTYWLVLRRRRAYRQ